MKRALLVAALAAGSLSCAGLRLDLGQLTAGVVAAAGSRCTPEKLRSYELTEENEYWFGRSVAARLLAPYVSQHAVYEPTSPEALYLNEVGQVALASALGQRDPGGGLSGLPRRFAWARHDDAPDRPVPVRGYHFILVRDASPGAWGVPGGFVIVTDGLVTRATSEDQLAGVLSHEIAHVQRGHGVEVVKRAMCEDKATSELISSVAASVSFDRGPLDGLPLNALVDLLGKVSNSLVTALVDRGYDPAYEYEADAVGTRYLAGSGYSALGMADYLRGVQADPAFANSKTHPPAAHRAELIESEVSAEKLQPARSPDEPARCKRFALAFRGGR